MEATAARNTPKTARARYWDPSYEQNGALLDLSSGTYAKAYDNKYNHFETRYARDKRFKLYGDGRLFDAITDVLEERPIPAGRRATTAEMARRKLQTALMTEYPALGSRIEQRQR